MLVASDGQGMSFVRKVHLNGTFEAGSRDGDWNDTGNNPIIAEHWAALQAGWHWRWQANVNWDWGILVKQVEDGLKIAGTVVSSVAAIVAIF